MNKPRIHVSDCTLAEIHLIVNLLCCMEYNPLYFIYNFLYFDCLCAFTLDLYHPSYPLCPWPNPTTCALRSGPTVLALGFRPCPSQRCLARRSCRWEERERRHYRYELWNGKKLFIVQCRWKWAVRKCTRTRGRCGWLEDLYIEGEGRIRRERACFGSQHLTWITATVTWKDLLCLSVCLPGLIVRYCSFDKG